MNMERDNIISDDESSTYPFSKMARLGTKRTSLLINPETPCGKRPLVISFSPSSVHSANTNVYSILEAANQHEKRITFDFSQLASTGYTVKNRAILVEWMRSFVSDHRLCDDTYYLSVLLLDRFFSSKAALNYSKSKFQMIAGVCLLIATKFNEVRPFSPKQIISCLGVSDSVEDVVGLERVVLYTCDWSILSSTFCNVIYHIVDHLSAWINNEERDSFLHCCISFCDYLLLFPKFYDFSLVDVVISVIRVVRGSCEIQIGTSLICRMWVEEEYERWCKAVANSIGKKQDNLCIFFSTF